MNKGHEEYEKYLEAFRAVAKEYKGKVLFVTIDTDEEDHDRILEFFGMRKEDIPDMRLIKLEEEMTKFRPQTKEINEGNIRQFVKDVLSGQIKQHLLSEEIPDDWDKHAVKTLVSKNFDEVVFDKSKDVLVEFCKNNSSKLLSHVSDKDFLPRCPLVWTLQAISSNL